MIRFSRRVVLTAPVAAALGYAAAQPIFSALAQDLSVPEATLPVTVTNADGSEVTIDDISRIVPLSGDIAEIVWDLGLGGSIVGVDVSATWPEELLEMPKIGYERLLNAESILALEPTVVIGKATAGPPEVLDQIRGAGVPVVIVDSPETIDAPNVKIGAVAAAVGVGDTPEAEALNTRVRDEIQAAIELGSTAENQPNVLLMILQGSGVQLISGGGTVANAMIESAGAIDAGKAAGIMGYQPVTPELLVAAAPDFIVSMAGGAQGVGGIPGIMELPGIAETPAGQNDHIILYDDELLLAMTPRTGQQLMAMIADFHPELAEAAGAAEAADEATPVG